MRIGPHTLANPWILAPMAGVSEMPFRVIARRFGASMAPTELVSSKGLLYGQARTARYLTHAASEQPFWVQIFGGDAESMAEGAKKAVDLGARIIDINMGCPVRKVTKNGAGSGLLCDPVRAAKIVEAVRQASGVPVTAKIRAGWDHFSLNFKEMARALEEAGCAALAMHARTRAQGYSGHADWSLIKALVSATGMPVIGNGDVKTPADARRMMDETGCAAVMIGRAALGNPWIFQQLGTGSKPPSPQQRWEVVREHLDAHLSFVGDLRQGMRRFRSHLMWYTHGLVGAAAFRNEVARLEALPELLEVAEAFFTQTTDHHGSEPVAFDERTALG